MTQLADALTTAAPRLWRPIITSAAFTPSSGTPGPVPPPG